MKFSNRQTNNFFATEKMILTSNKLNTSNFINSRNVVSKQLKSCFFVGFVSVLMLLYFSYSLFTIYSLNGATNGDTEFVIKECYLNRNISEKYRLNDVLTDLRLPKPGKSFFFLETSCSSDGGSIKLNARQACAIESTAKHNPNSDVFVLFASAAHLNPQNVTPIIEALLNYSNVHFRNLNLWTFVKNTPLEEWFSQGAIFKSSYVMIHISDMLRLLTLYKFGGTYMDLDVVVKQSFENLEPNYAGAESDDLVANGLMNFDASGVGHELADMCVRDFLTNFNGALWSHNGPGVITRVLQTACETKHTQAMNRTRCKHFHVYNREAFYAIHYNNWKYFFEEKHFENAMKTTNHSLSIHVWNKLSRGEKVKVGTRVAYGVTAEENCPNVYGASGEYF